MLMAFSEVNSLTLEWIIPLNERLEMIRTQPELREKLWSIAKALQNGLKEKGFDIGRTGSPVTPVFLKGDEAEGSQVVADLRENFRIFCSMVIYPVVPRGVIMLRLIPTAVHTLEDVKYTIEAFDVVKQKLEAGEYNIGVVPSVADQY